MQHFTPNSHMIPIERFSARLGTTSHQGFRVKLYDGKKYEATSRNSTIKKLVLTLHSLHCTNSNYLP